MARIVPQPNPVILVFGAHLAFGGRIAYYLDKFSKEADRPIVLAVAEHQARTMEEAQEAMWRHYVGGDGGGRPTIVINADVCFDISRLEADPEWAFARNTIPAANIALAARTAGIPMVQISTDHVFYGTKGPYTDGDLTRGGNVFGVSMQYAEEVVHSFHPLAWNGNYQVGAVVVRVSSLYGYDFPHTIYVNRGASFSTSIVERDDVGVFSDLKSSPTFVGEAAFLLARNIIMTPQSLSQPVIHLAAQAPPISFYELLQDKYHGLGDATYYKEGWVQMPTVRVGSRLGLVPSKGWALPKDYQKGLMEAFIEEDAQTPIHYW